jgi:hypothetical protein
MTKRIIYKNEAGGVAVIIPANCGLTIEQIAEKDVPTGSPYKIVDVSEIPTDRAERRRWAVDFADDAIKASWIVVEQSNL